MNAWEGIERVREREGGIERETERGGIERERDRERQTDRQRAKV
jgi:hypothetical protein